MMKKMKRMFVMVLAVLMLFACAVPTMAATTVKLNKTQATVQVGQTVNLKLTGAGKNVKWTTGNKAVATVSKGKVTAKKEGTTTISATAGKKTYKCKVTVKNPAKLSKTSLALKEGNSASIKVTGLKSAPKNVSWKSSNTSVATVKGGTVKAVKAGSATITATVYGKKLTCKVSVAKKTTAAKTTVNKKNEFYDPYNYAEDYNVLSIKPKYIRYENGRLVATCYVINGFDHPVYNIHADRIRLYDSKGKLFADGSFGTLNYYRILGAHQRLVWDFVFQSGSFVKNADLTGKVAYKCNTSYVHR